MRDDATALCAALFLPLMYDLCTGEISVTVILLYYQYKCDLCCNGLKQFWNKHFEFCLIFNPKVKENSKNKEQNLTLRLIT